MEGSELVRGQGMAGLVRSHGAVPEFFWRSQKAEKKLIPNRTLMTLSGVGGSAVEPKQPLTKNKKGWKDYSTRAETDMTWT